MGQPGTFLGWRGHLHSDGDVGAGTLGDFRLNTQWQNSEELYALLSCYTQPFSPE